MLFHVDRIDVRIEVGILHGVAAGGMAEHMLSDIGTGDFIEISGSSMPEQMRVQMFVHAQLCHGSAQEILHRVFGDSFVAFGEQQRALSMVACLQIAGQCLPEDPGQRKQAPSVAFIAYPQQAAVQVDVCNIELKERPQPKSQETEQRNGPQKLDSPLGEKLCV